jgi:hypothetical protein
MTGPDQRGNPRPSIADTMQGTERLVRQAGRDFIVAFYTALRSLKLYPLENSQVQRSLDDLHNAVSAVVLLVV